MHQRVLCAVFAAIVLIIGVTASSLTGQTVTGRITGTVTDETGAVLPGVEITVRNRATGVSRTVLTQESGTYNVPLLQPAVYEVEASLAGFRREIRSGITVQVDSAVRLDFLLRVGEIANEIQVTADAPLVESESSTVGQVIDTQKVVELPLNSRNFMELNLLTPGVQPNVEGSNLSTQGTSIHVNGAQELFNNFLLDGVDNNDSANGQLVIMPSIDAIQEFKVQTNTYGAQFGRAGGGVVNVQTKSGTNAFHGTVFEFLRNDVLDARNFFADRKSAFRRNQFGGVLTGPIIRDRLFLMFNYEGKRLRKGEQALANVPTPLERIGDFSQSNTTIMDPFTGRPFPGNILPRDRIDPIGQKIVDFFPFPNRVDPRNNFLTTTRKKEDTDIFTGRIDFRMSDKHTIFGRYAHQEADQIDPQFSAGGSTLPGFAGIFKQPIGRNAMVSDSYVISTSMVNEFRIGFNRIIGGIFEELSQKGDLTKGLGIRGVQSQIFPNPQGRNFGFPRVDIAGFSNFRGSFQPQNRIDNTWHVFDMLAWTKGNHQMKMGAEYRTFLLNVFFDRDPNGRFVFTGRFTGNGLADALLGFPEQTGRTVGDSKVHDHNRSAGVFFQDDWKLTPNLTLNLGLRWELQTPPTNAIGDKAFFDEATGQIVIGGQNQPQAFINPVTGQQIIVAGGRPLGVPKAGFTQDNKDFAPRIGFAYSPFGSGNLVVRGGYGIFYNPLILSRTAFFRTGAYPFDISESFFADRTRPNITMQNPFPSEIGVTSITSSTVARRYRNGYMQSWNLGIQYPLGSSTVLDVQYAGSKGTKLDFNRNINQARLGPGPVNSRRPYPQFSTITKQEKSLSSIFNSLQARAERRFTRGFTFIAAYTWSHSIDYNSGSSGTGGGDAQNSFNLREERGNSVFDVRNRVVLSYVYELPIGRGKPFMGSAGGAFDKLIGGWQISGINTFAGGQHFTVEVAGDLSGTGIAFVRPNRIKKEALLKKDPSGYIDPSAFAIPASGTFGNSGRGILTAPGINNWDFTIMKTTHVSESQRLQFRAEFFDLFNRPNFLVPERRLNSRAFGTILRAKDGRDVQLSLKWIF